MSTTIDFNSTINQEIKRQFVSKHVYANVGTMVEYILRAGFEDNNAPFTIDDVENYYSYPEYIGTYANFEGGTESQRDNEINRLNDLFEESGIDSDQLQTEINELENLEQEASEVYEWWMVSSWLCEKLRDLGHPVLMNENIWGRCTSGQAILLDHDIEILDGQPSSWSK